MNWDKDWNRCDVCGRWIAIMDFAENLAIRHEVTPDSAYTAEEWETLCPKHTKEERNARKRQRGTA